MHWALNQLSIVAPAWVQHQVPLEWYPRYDLRFDQTRLPKDASKRKAMARQVGADGYQLLAWVQIANSPGAAQPAGSGGAAADLAAAVLPLYRPWARNAALARAQRATACSGARGLALRPRGPLQQ